MKKIEVNEIFYNSAEFKELKAQTPSAKHVSQMIDEPAEIYVNGKRKCVYFKAPFNCDELKDLCNYLKFNDVERTGGLQSQTISLNASGRNPLHDFVCKWTKLKREQPDLHEKFMNVARKMSKIYLEYFRQQFVNQAKLLYLSPEKVREYYRIFGTPFTGGVINKNSALGYHFDAANTDDGISCMVILKSNQAGGELILPQLDIGFTCDDCFVLLFDGKNYLHGVTPIISNPAVDNYRYTIVYYANEGMKVCMTPEQEELHYQQHLEKQAELKNKQRMKNESK